MTNTDNGPILEHPTLLLVDDDEAVRGMLAMGIESLGYRVITASNAGEALEAARADPGLWIAIVDIRMPEMSGVELAGLLREVNPGMRTLFCSGSTLESLCQDGLSLENEHYLLKPVSLADLKEKLAEICVG